jgi:preprotein translocase subunit SecF
MEFFKSTKTIDFLKYRRLCAIGSSVVVAASLLGLFVPGPNYGIDFRGGTELEVEFKGKVTSAELRDAVTGLGYRRPEVVEVTGKDNRFIIRIQEVSSLAADKVDKIRSGAQAALGAVKIDAFKVSPGGDKIALRFSESVDTATVEKALVDAGARVRAVAVFGSAQDNRFEVMLSGVGDEVVKGLHQKLGDRAPETPLRVEWVGPKAGEQLRTAALKAMLYAIAFILVYVAFRFDLRFAPGGIVALLHDALVVVGAYVLLQKEFTLGTVAAILTVIGYSINDTIVIYDRIRENMQRMRDVGLGQLINVSTTQTLSRTIITSSVTMLSILGFFVWGTPVIQDIVFALAIGFISGTYSTIYIAAPFTEWMDRRFFRRAA